MRYLALVFDTIGEKKPPYGQKLRLQIYGPSDSEAADDTFLPEVDFWNSVHHFTEGTLQEIQSIFHMDFPFTYPEELIVERLNAGMESFRIDLELPDHPVKVHSQKAVLSKYMPLSNDDIIEPLYTLYIANEFGKVIASLTDQGYTLDGLKNAIEEDEPPFGPNGSKWPDWVWGVFEAPMSDEFRSLDYYGRACSIEHAVYI